MPRDTLRSKEYFDKYVNFYDRSIPDVMSGLVGLGDEAKARRSSRLWDYSLYIVLYRYSGGDSVADMRNSVLQILEMLELKCSTLAGVQLEPDVRQMYERLDLSTLYESLTLLSFMVSLRFPAKDVLHTLKLIGHPGEDALLDQVAHAFGDKSRSIAAQSRFPKVYDGLVNVVTSPPEQQPDKLKKFVEGWYKRMKPIYWHDNHKGAEGAYFGYWCFEAALIAMLFDVDDAGLADHPNYPADLVRHYRNAA